MRLRVAQIVDRTEAEGPGQRFALWAQGCPLRCSGCCNPEMFGDDGGDDVTTEALAARAAAAIGVEGITLLGGEPFAQAAACADLARRARDAGLSVMVFTGYTLAELEAERADPGTRALLDACDLLVDGRYQREVPERSSPRPPRRWIGSQNQVMHFLTPRYAPTDPRFFAPNTAEIRLTREALAMNGWPALVPTIRRARG